MQTLKIPPEETEREKIEKHQKMQEYISDMTEEELDQLIDYALTLCTQHTS